MSKKVFVAPYGSVIPSDSHVRAVPFTDFRELVTATNDLSDEEPNLCLIPSSLEVLRLAIKYAEHFDLEFVAFEGVPGGNYDMMWDQTIYPLERVSFVVLDDAARNQIKPVTRKSDVQQARSELARYETERPSRAPTAKAPPSAAKWDDADDSGGEDE